jgi:hypothetical protein
MKLRCQGYDIHRWPSELVAINAKLILMIPPTHVDEISEALKHIELYLASELNLVMATGDRPRCFYCGVLGDESDKTCSQCGAPL